MTNDEHPPGYALAEFRDGHRAGWHGEPRETGRSAIYRRAHDAGVRGRREAGE